MAFYTQAVFWAKDDREGEADCYFPATTLLMNWEAFNCDGPTLSSTLCSYSCTTCPMIETELYKALVLEFSWLCRLLEKMNQFTLKWTWEFPSGDGDESCQCKRIISTFAGIWMATYWAASKLGRETDLSFFFKKHIVFSLILQNSDNSDFERVNNVYYFLQIPGIYSAFILDMFYGFENSVNSIFFF